MKDEEIIEIFGQLKISKTETSLYLQLLSSGPVTISSIARNSGMPRTTVRENIMKLIDKRLASEIIRQNGKLIKAASPEKLHLLLDEKVIANKEERADLLSINPKLKKIIDSLKKVNPAKEYETEVQYFEEKRLIQELYDRILDSKEVRAYVDAIKINKYFPENFYKFKERVAGRAIQIWDISVYSEDTVKLMIADDDRAAHHKVKFFPKGFKIDQMDYLIYDGNIAVIQAGKRLEAVNIKNALMYENAKTIFDLMWNFLPNP